MKWLQEGLVAGQHQAINIKTRSQPLLLLNRKQSALSFVVFIFIYLCGTGGEGGAEGLAEY